MSQKWTEVCSVIILIFLSDFDVFMFLFLTWQCRAYSSYCEKY